MNSRTNDETPYFDIDVQLKLFYRRLSKHAHIIWTIYFAWRETVVVHSFSVS